MVELAPHPLQFTVRMEKDTFELRSPQLRNTRAIDVYLPASYGDDGRRRFPVVYMHDGQNLSDPSIAFGGNTWQLGGAFERLAAHGLDAIVVGVYNAGTARLGEYSPFADRRHGGGRGERYVRFLEETLKPRIEARYRVRKDRDATIVAGSSMGGLISLYAFFRMPSAFGKAAVMSPSIWFGGRRILEFVDASPAVRGRLYLDVGTEEGAATLRDARALARIVRSKGYGRGDFRYVEGAGHKHRETDWADRLPDALQFLLR
jgi:predicted alpha/beta superfamily hydrolase